MKMLDNLKGALAKAAQNVADGLAPVGETDATAAPPIFQYAAKMDRPGRLQKTWVFQQYDDVTAVQFALAGVAEGGSWYGWTIARLLRINWPAPATLIPLDPPPTPEADV